MTKYTATIVTANLRDVDGCDSDAAVAALVKAAGRAAAKYSKIHGVDLDVEEFSPVSERNSKTVLVSHDVWGGADFDATMEADKVAEDIMDAIDYAIDQAIQDGDW